MTESSQLKAVIVCGSRHWTDEGSGVFDQGILFARLYEVNPDVVIHGDCKGADTRAQQWCEHTIMDDIPMPAQWERDGNAAGPIRNQRMLDVLLALRDCGYAIGVEAFVLPSSCGTWDMVRKAKAAGVDVNVTRNV